MSDASSYDLPQGKNYYYQPLTDNGPYEETLKKAGSAVAKALIIAEAPQASAFTKTFGSAAGSFIGSQIGFYVDNASAIVQNTETLLEQLNDYQTWADPVSSALMDE